MTERITDERELMMCPLRDDGICTRGGIEVDHHECGSNFNMTYRACALWHDGRCDISRIAVHMSLLPTSDIAIPERTCHIVLGDESNHAPHCDACGGVVYEMMPSYCPNCGARVVTDDD